MDTLPPYTQRGDSCHIVISLSQGKVAIVDREDADLAMYKWHVTRGRYAVRRPRTPDKKAKGPAISMHRVILERKLGRSLLTDTVVDHINGDGLVLHSSKVVRKQVSL